MKKALSILLTLALLLTSLWSVAGTAMAATVSSDYFENPDNWQALVNNDIVGTNANGTNAIEQRTASTGETYAGGDIAIRFWHNMHNRAAVIALPVEQGKTYKLSFQYKATFSTGSDYDITHSGVYEKGAVINNAIEGTALANMPIQTQTDNDYHTYELTFTVGTNTELYFVARFWTAAKVWFDEFKLVDATPTYYEIADNWNTLYGDDVVGVSTTNRVSISSVTSDTYENGPAAICFSGTMHNRTAAIALPVEAGKTYNLSFMYKGDFNGSNTSYNIKKSGVFEKGATIVSQEGPDGTAVAMHTGTGSITDKTVYNLYELTFTVGDNTELYFAAHFWTASWVWIDDFKLVDITPTYYEIADNWNTLYGDDVVGVSTTNRVTIAQTKTDTYENSPAAICFSGIMHNRTAAIALPVEAGKTYKLSFMYKGDFNGSNTSYSIKKSGVFEKGATIVTQKGPNGTAVAIHKENGSITDKTVYNSYELVFTVYDNTELYFAIHFWNTSWVWIDEFELQEIASESGFETAYNSMAAIRAASNTDGSVVKNGLRIYNSVENEWTNNTNIVEYGSFVVRKEYMEQKFGEFNGVSFDTVTVDGTERTLKDLIGSGVGLGVAYRANGAATITSAIEGYEGAKEVLWNSDATQKIFTSYITGISSEHYGDDYLVRTYAIDNDGNIYYGNVASVSIFKVAQAISVANNNIEIDNAAFEAFVGSEPTVYENWCAENSLEVGQLYTELYSK